MIKPVKNTMEAYGEEAKRYDYFIRILSSFAEIYNYDCSLSRLLVDGTLFGEDKEILRKNGIFPRIHGYFLNHFNEFEVPMKCFYQEVVYSEGQHQEYGYLTMGHFDESVMADMIALALRLLETCGLRNLNVVLAQENSVIERYLDSLDIPYSLKDLTVSNTNSIAFEISNQQNNQEMVLLRGGCYSSFAKELSGLDTQVFGFFGYLEDLVSITRDSLVLEEKMLDIVVTYETEKELEYALYLTQELRLNGFKSEYIKRCEKRYIKENYNTKYVLSVKEEGIEKSEFLLTDLYTNEKEIVKEMDLIQHLDMNF